jgi:hypothetical protein
VTTEAKISPIMTDFTTRSACMNMLHGDKSRGSLWASTLAMGVGDAAAGAGVIAGAST